MLLVAMIISPQHHFALVHIPKCAGTSVRHQLRTTDEGHIFTGGPRRHDELGVIDYAHIPLATLRSYMPREYALLREYDSFALARDPLERFGSALRQLFWQYEKRPMTLIPVAEIRQTTLGLLDKIASEIDNPSSKFIFFARQSSFIFDQGKQVTDHVLPVSLVPQLLDYYSRRIGVVLDRDRYSNQNAKLRYKKLGKIAYAMNSYVRSRLPPEMHARIKSMVLRLIAKPTNAAQASGVLDMPEIRAFVQDKYAGDIDIYARVMQQEP